MLFRYLHIISVFTFIFWVGNSYAQTRTIYGRITNTSEQPVWDAMVSNDDSTCFSKTDVNGFYSIEITKSVQFIKVSKNGFTTQIIPVNDSNEYNITLQIAHIHDMSFEDLLQTRVSLVSLKDQKINEAPGIISVLTQEDLKQLGIRTIREALTYVAGFAPLQNDDELIMAVRGIFATTNQKILVMRDGHSLNEGNLDIPQTDYSIAIENIKKIEIIRGPGASIYGNSALAAVINMVTIDDGSANIKIGFGNYGQKNFEAYTHEKLSSNTSVLFFGRIAGTGGEPFNVKYQTGMNNESFDGNYKTHQYPGAFDIGVRLKGPYFNTSLSTQYHHYKTYWSSNGFYTNTDSLLHDLGLKQQSLHYDLTLTPKIFNTIQLNLQHYFDVCQLRNSRLTAPIDDKKFLYGRIQLNEWNVVKSGFNYYGSYSFNEGDNLLAGISFENRAYLDSWVANNNMDSSTINYQPTPFYPQGDEYRGALFIQAQHSFFNWFKADVGGRFDAAQKFNSAFNPRLAFLFYPGGNLNLKLIYTQAFQAPGYSYRTSNADFSGSIESLKPEKLSTFQFVARYEYLSSSFLEISAYYNELTNLITRTDQSYYANHGKLATYGLETEIRFNQKLFSFMSNSSVLLPFQSKIDEGFKTKNIKNNRFRNLPMFMMNNAIALHLFKKVDFSLAGQYYSSYFSSLDEKEKQRIIFNSTLNINQIAKNFTLAFSIYNLANLKYKLGDPSVRPLEQPGRWMLLSVTYKIH